MFNPTLRASQVRPLSAAQHDANMNGLASLGNANEIAISALTTGSAGVTTISGGSTGLTPNTPTSGAVTLSGTLAVGNGGTGVTTSTGTGNNVLSASPTLTGVPIAPTASGGTNTTQIATTQFVQNAVSVAGGMTYPAPGIGSSTGSDWGASYTTSGSGTVLALATSPVFVTPNLGTPSAITLTNATGLPAATGITGTLPVANGGTGVTTSTGTGSNVLSANPALTGVPTAPTASVGTNTTQIATTQFVQKKVSFLGTSDSIAAILTNAAETVNLIASGAGGALTLQLYLGAVQFFNVNATANWSLNISLSASCALNAALSVGQSVTIAVLAKQGTTAYCNTSITIDGSAITPYWQGGSPPSAGNANGIDVYTYTIIKTSDAAFTVLASLVQF